jgi:hypothetical protein
MMVEAVMPGSYDEGMLGTSLFLPIAATGWYDGLSEANSRRVFTVLMTRGTRGYTDEESAWHLKQTSYSYEAYAGGTIPEPFMVTPLTFGFRDRGAAAVRLFDACALWQSAHSA